jgi:O-methyltransferase involved in polyketide biosynthesis
MVMSFPRDPTGALDDVSRTLFVCLYARARESSRPEAIIRDDKAVEIVEESGLDFRPYRSPGWAQVATAVRTAIIDRSLHSILTGRDGAAVINLGAGLCTRSFRIQRGWSRWFDIDLPEVEPLWNRWIGTTERRSFVPASLSTTEWLADLPAAAHYVFIAEGSLIYLQVAEVIQLLDAIAARFPDADLLIEAMGRLGPRLTALNSAIHRTGAQFQWGVRSLGELTHWCPRLGFVDEWFYLDEYAHRWGVYHWLNFVPELRRQMKVGHLYVAEDVGAGPPRYNDRS